MLRYVQHCAALMHFQFLVILVPDPCLSDPCDVNAICEREGLLSDHFVCTCQPPFTEGTGFNCSGMTCNKIVTFLICMTVLIQVCKPYKKRCMIILLLMELSNIIILLLYQLWQENDFVVY